MPKKMLIDASHPEETRVVIIDGHRIEDFDFESVSKKPLKGNIYLAKVTRVEPSLQAAFVEYGGNRHGFLAFSEIHPDYYQIPMADRQALIEAERINRSRDDEGDDEERPRRGGGRNRGRRQQHSGGGHRNANAPASSEEETQAGESSGQETSFESGQSSFEGSDSERFESGHDHDHDRGPDTSMQSGETERSSEQPEFAPSEAVDAEFSDESRDDVSAAAEPDYPPRHEQSSPYSDSDIDSDERSEERPRYTVSAEGAIPEAISLPADGLIDDENGNVSEIVAEPVVIDTVGGEGEDDDSDDEDASEERPVRPARHRPYKIQEVIKRRQVMLVQVVKEERGNKGAALTSYLSLAGRYCVLMPNTPRGGGISRKITNQNDRRRLKEIAAELEVPEGMGVIIRTAGAARTRQEIRRDYEYLLRLWESVREMTLESTAPSLIYEEGDIIKRAIRDSFTKDIEEVLVQGREAFENARAFMNMLMPAQSKAVRLYDERVPLFQAYKVESYLDAMFSPRVQLRSGGYIVINATEALVAVDVNSGRATREHSIEETALKTNLEASEEVARQLRLRDLAGLVVIDYIDMEEGRNNRAVEKRLKDCLRHDRARIQVGRISPFGLLEMSRQRLRAGVVEGSTSPCPHCDGTGAIRSVESMSLRVLRAVEEDGQKFKDRAVTVRVPTDVALYILNQKRYELSQIESRANIIVFVEAKPALLGADYEIVPGVPQNFKPRRAADNVIGPQTVLSEDAPVDPEFEDAEESVEAEVFAEESDVTDVETSGEDREAKQGRDDERGGGRKRRRRGRGRGRDGERDKGGRDEGGRGRRPAQARDTQPGPAVAASVRADNASDEDGDDSEGAVAAQGVAGESEESQEQRRRRRRGRRGGRRHRRERGEGRPEGVSANGTSEAIGESEMQGESHLAPDLPQAEHRPRGRAQRDAEHVVAADHAPREESVRHETHDDRASHSHQEPKTERPSSIASFFGFGTKQAEPAAPEAPRDTGPAKRGWWKK